MIRSFAILGGGSAGLLAALTLRRVFSKIDVAVIHSSEIGVIGVGEGTTPIFTQHLLDYLRMDPATFHAEAQPTWKLGLQFAGWGSRREFYYAFHPQFDVRLRELPRSAGYYAFHECQPANLVAALMAADKVFLPRADGAPLMQTYHALHIENEKLVRYLEKQCRALGVNFIEGKVTSAARTDDGIDALTLEDGRQIRADLYIDASGFRAELLGGAMAEPFRSYGDSLFCDRAVIGGWPRTDEPIKPYTKAEAMDAGWCWQIEHEHFINRGYVFSSRFLSDDAAREEFLRKNTRVATEPRLVKFRSGAFERTWVGNVLGIGNSAGFVEPLEATALALIIVSVRVLVEVLRDCDGEVNPTLVDFYNRTVRDVWNETRDFLALHYKLNTHGQGAFWHACREETKLGALDELMRFYEENGPSLLARHSLTHPNNIFGLEGHLAMLVGQKAPYRRQYQPSPRELEIWRAYCSGFARQAAGALDVRQSLAAIRASGWEWERPGATANAG